MLVSAIKELDVTVKELNQSNDALKKRLEKLENK